MAVAETPATPAPAAAPDNYLTHGRGLLSWLLTLDHKRIGVMYLIAIVSSLFLGGFFALVIRTHLSSPNHQFLSKDMYNQMFTLHGAVMIFLFLIPSTPAALGNFVLP
jgi:cytochrome c oxidase subunit I